MPFVKAVSHLKKPYLHFFVFFYHAPPKQKTLHKLFAIPVSQLHFLSVIDEITTAVGHFDNGMFFKKQGLLVRIPFVKGLVAINLTVQSCHFAAEKKTSDWSLVSLLSRVWQQST